MILNWAESTWLSVRLWLWDVIKCISVRAITSRMCEDVAGDHMAGGCPPSPAIEMIHNLQSLTEAQLLVHLHEQWVVGTTHPVHVQARARPLTSTQWDDWALPANTYSQVETASQYPPCVSSSLSEVIMSTVSWNKFACCTRQVSVLMLTHPECGIKFTVERLSDGLTQNSNNNKSVLSFVCRMTTAPPINLRLFSCTE